MADEWTFVRAAFGLTWLVLAAYSFYLGQRRRRARQRLESLES